MNIHEEYGEYLGNTTDSCGRYVDVFKDIESMFIVYDLDTNHEYSTSAPLIRIQEDPDNYLFTPYVDFIDPL